jgi:hypothetical protein
MAKQKEEDASAFIVDWDRGFRLSLLDWFTKQVEAINGDLALIQEFTTDLCSTPLRAAEQELLRLMGKPPQPTNLHPDVVKRKKGEEKPVWLKIEWKNNDMEKVELSRILKLKQVRDLHPDPVVDARIRISYSLGKPLGVWMANVQRDSEFAPNEEIVVLDPRVCPCHKYRTGAELDFAGHVVTTDPGCFADPQLRRFCLYGRKYRLSQHPDGMREAIDEALEAHVARFAEMSNVEEYDAWKTEVMKRVDMRLEDLQRQGFAPGAELSPGARKELQDFQRDMTITFADKSSHDFVMICKAAYRTSLFKELGSNDVYRPLEKPLDEVLNLHADLARKWGQDPVASVAHLYGVVKLHKTPAQFRWIAGAHAVRISKEKKIPTTSIGQSAAALGGVLRQVMATLKQKDLVEYQRTGIRRYWIVTAAEEAAARLRALDPKVLGRLWTRDFSAMYTSLPRHRLLRQVSEAIHEAFEYQAKQQRCPVGALGFKVKYDYKRKATAEFQQGAPYSERDVQDLLEAVLQGTLLQQGPLAPMLLQEQGIPMGGKASSEIANLYCYAIEAAMVDEVLRDYGLPAARRFATNQRFIDDIQGFGEINWPALQYGMEHKETTDPSGSALFLGMRITRFEDSLLLEQEPKGRGWSWRPQRYLEATSTHTHFTRRSVFKGLCVRAGSITNTRKAFKDAVLQVAEGLVLRGYGIQALQRSWKEYLMDYFRAQPQERQLLEEWFSAWMSAAFPEAQWRNEASGQSEREADRLADKAWTVVNEVLRAMELRPLERIQVRELCRSQTVRWGKGPGGVDVRRVRTQRAGALAVQLLQGAGVEAAEMALDQEPEWAGLLAVLVVKSYEFTVFERTGATWVRVNGTVLTKVTNVAAAVRAAANQWGGMIGIRAPQDAAVLPGLLVRLAAGAGAVAIAPRDKGEDVLPFPPVEPMAVEAGAAEAQAEEGPANAELAPSVAIPGEGRPELAAEPHGDPLLAEAPQSKRGKPEEWARVMVGTIALLGSGSWYRCPIEGCNFEKQQEQSVLKHYVRHRDKRNVALNQEGE